MPRVGLRSGPKTRQIRSIWKNVSAELGLLRSPARDKPAHHKQGALNMHTTLVITAGLILVALALYLRA